MSTAGQAEQTGAATSDLSLSVADARMSLRQGLLLALGYLPLLTIFLVDLTRNRPHYQFFPLALAGAGFLGWSRLKEVPRPLEPGNPGLTKLLLAASLGCLAAATLFWSPWLGTVATFIGGIGVLWWMGGRPLLRAMVPALLLVLTIIPPPMNADTRAIEHLRVLAVTWSSHLLDVLGVTHSLSGNVIELPGQKLLVDEACSGINSVLVTLAACLFYGLWRRRSAVSILVCLGSTLAVVLLGNLARITVGAWLRFRYDIDILSGRPHELVGLVLFVIYLTMIVSTDQVMVFLTTPSRPQPAPPESPPARAAADRKPRSGALTRSWAQAAGYGFALLGLVSVGVWAIERQRSKAPIVPPKSALRAGATFALPEQIGEWKRLTTEVPPLQKIETRGIFSQVWHYRRGDTLASLAIDYPFQGYHELAKCYVLRGWDLREQRVRIQQGTNAVPPFAEMRMQNDLGMHGTLWYALVDERGRWLPRPTRGRSLKERALERFKTIARRQSVTYQVQVLTTSFDPPKPQDLNQVRQFFDEGRDMLWRQLFEQMQRKS
jgi:exosortase